MDILQEKNLVRIMDISGKVSNTNQVMDSEMIRQETNLDRKI